MTLPKAHTYKDLHTTLQSLTQHSKCDYTYATTQPLLFDIPQQFEMELSLKDHNPDDVPKVQSMMDTISEVLQGMEYGLFNLVATPTKDKVKGYFVASPTLTEAVTRYKGKYTLTIFQSHLEREGWTSHQQQSLRDITRYLSGGKLDSTAKRYYTSWFKSFVYRQIDSQCSRIVDVPHWIMRHALDSQSPTEIRDIEKGVLEALLQSHSAFVTRTKSFNKSPSYPQFIKQHI